MRVAWPVASGVEDSMSKNSGGKSYLALRLAMHLGATRQGGPVVIISQEMSRGQLMARLGPRPLKPAARKRLA